jgi:hypothetical protein
MSCSPDVQSGNFNWLILIPFGLGRAMHAGVSPSEAPVIRAARPRGIPNPKRRVPDLAARPLRAGALSDLIDCKTYLLRPLAAQLFPPPLPSTDPEKHLGIDLLVVCVKFSKLGMLSERG